MNRVLLCCALAVMFSSKLSAQDAHVHGPWCASDEVKRELVEQFPHIADIERNYEDEIRSIIAHNRMQKSEDEDVYTIPVVFHILHNRGPENISDERIYRQVNILNEHFRKLAPDTTQVIDLFKPIHADTKIQFKLANLAPDGSCTNGINRVNTGFIDDDRSGRNKFERWPRHIYLNVWVVNSIPAFGAGTTLGYAFLPPGVDDPNLAFLDGIMMWWQATGDISDVGLSFSSTLTHECGHFLNLLHTWGDGQVDTSCGDDAVEDTPITRGRFGCPTSAQAMICNSNVVENWQNYMDYSSCTYMYTEGQKERMRATLASNVAARSVLVSPAANAIAGVDTDEITICAPEVNFYPSNYYACVNTPITWNPEIARATADTYSWSFPGADITSSTERNPEVSYSTPGWKTVSLTAGSEGGSDSKTNEFAIYVYDQSVSFGDVYEENFWDGAAINNGWTVRPANENLLVQGVNWGYSPIGCLDQGSLRVNLFDSSTPESYRVVTPRLNLEGRNGQTLSFKYAYATQANPADVNVRLRVLSTSNCGSSTVARLTISEPAAIITGGNSAGIPFEPNNPILWRTASFVVSQAQAVNGVQYEFELNTDFGVNNFYIDNFTIGNTLVSAEDEGPLGDTKLFPNPANDYAQLELVLNRPETVSVRIFDLAGKQVQHIQGQAMPAGANVVRINTAALSAGVYTVRVDGEAFQRSLKLVVQP